MPTYTPYPTLTFADSYAQPSDGYAFGRRLTVNFDSTNIYTLLSDGNTFSDPTGLVAFPVIVQVEGTTMEGPTFENFIFTEAGDDVGGSLHFTQFEGVSIIDGYRINASDSYGSVEVRETLPINVLDDGYDTPYVQFTAYGNGLFLFDTSIKDAYGDNVDPGYGEYKFDYLAPFRMPLKVAPETLYIGNNEDLTNAADGVLDEVKITTATATKTRSRKLAGSYDISIEASSPISGVPDAKTLVLLHLDDNSQFIVDSLRNPLDSLNLADSILANIVSLRNDKDAFIAYVDSLNISGSIVEESVDLRPLSAQLFDLVTALNTAANSAHYFKLAGNFLPSETIVNDNFKYAAVFNGEQYFIERPGLINNKEGSIELWIAPLNNTLGDFTRRVYLDVINHAIIGKDGNLISVTANLIELPNNISAKQINSIRIAGPDNDYDFAVDAVLSANGSSIVLNKPLPANNTPVMVDYIPATSTNDRITLFKDEYSVLIFALSANGILYQLSTDISHWQKNEWHRVMITWKTDQQNNLDHMNLFVDGIESTIIKYGQGFLYNTFKFKEEHQADIETKIIPLNIQFNGSLERLYFGTDFLGAHQGFCRMSNVRVSFIERQPIIDARGKKIDFNFDGGSKSATPVIVDAFTTVLEDFNPKAGFVNNFATLQDISGEHDLKIIVRDDFRLVRGIQDGQIERLLRELIKIIKPAEARARVFLTTNG